MPELPEVETIARNLRTGSETSPALEGCTILSVEVLWPRTTATPPASEFDSALAGQQILRVGRRAKFLVLKLTQGTLLVHLRMSGDLRVEQETSEVQPHDRAIFHLEGGWKLVFNDARKFGRIWYTLQPEDVLGHLGPEPLDEAFTDTEFHQRLIARRRQLKPLLLDQSFLAGLGNIYTDESLHMAKLHPNTLSDTVTPQQAASLLQAIRAVLQEGIRRNGASIDWVYRGGSFQNSFRAYQRTGEPCPVCGTPIMRTVVGQRGTHFCPNCQPEPNRS